MSRSPFIEPAQPFLRDRPPKGEAWLHEVKFDGYRVQLHKEGKDVAIYSRNGQLDLSLAASPQINVEPVSLPAAAVAAPPQEHRAQAARVSSFGQ